MTSGIQRHMKLLYGLPVPPEILIAVNEKLACWLVVLFLNLYNRLVRAMDPIRLVSKGNALLMLCTPTQQVCELKMVFL